MKISVLGPKGTFSQQAAIKYDKNAEILFEKTIKDVFESVSNNIADVGIVPLENSVTGTIGVTREQLTEGDAQITAEIVIPIRHNLVGKDKNAISTMYANSQAHAQCFNYIHEHFPRANVIHVSSNSEAAKKVAESDDPKVAGIVPETALDVYQLTALEKDIQDNEFNVTKFIVLSNEKTSTTGRDRTTISVTAQIDKPGLLYNMLGEFAKRNINLSKIESAPSKGKLGIYYFFIDFEGHKDDDAVKEVFENIKQDFFLKVHGSYAREY